jgi:hypothetical protein
MTGAMAEGTAGTTGGAMIVVDGTAIDGTAVVPDGIGITAIDLIGGIIPVIGGLTGASGKLLHRKAVQYGERTRSEPWQASALSKLRSLTIHVLHRFSPY